MKKLLFILAFFVFLLTPIASFASTEDGDSIAYTLDLNEIVVTARVDYFKIKGPNKFAYEVSKDPTLRDAMTIDALKNVPILNARNNGEVSAMNGTPLRFKINGLQDPMLSNLSQALTAIPASSIKSIEFKNEVSGEGRSVIEVNIITKERLEGYRAQLTSNISDSQFRNGVWAMSKVRRFSFNGSYFNTWQWGHKSTYGSEEYRYSTPGLYRYETLGEDNGYKVDLHNFEAGASYEVDDSSFLNFFGSAMLKTDPHINSFSTHAIFDQKGDRILSYENLNNTKMKDAEYSASLKFERNFNNSSKPGHLNIGYGFYNRPTGSNTSNVYERIDCKTDADIGFLNLSDSKLKTDKSYITNTFVGEWKKMPNRRMLLEVYGRFRARHESYQNNMETWPLGAQHIVIEHSNTTLNEYFGVITPKILYFTDWWEVRAGAVVEAYRHNVKATGIDGHITNKKAYVFPFLSGAMVTNKKLTIELSYNMGNSIPDITALDPYVDRTTPGEIRYGNPYLQPQMNHTLKLDIGGKTGRLYTAGTLTASYIDDIILSYQFVKDGLLNHTYGNIANRRGISLSGYTSGRLHSNTYLRINASVDWNQYRSGFLSMANKGWQMWIRARLEQELPWGVTMDASASYSSRPVMLQGDGSHDFSYELGFYKQFLKRSLTVRVDASSFLPILFKQTATVYASDYSSHTWRRTFHASFSFSIRYTFGRLNARAKENSFEIDNSEIKKSYE